MTTQRDDVRGLVDEMRATDKWPTKEQVLAWADRLSALSAPGEPVAKPTIVLRSEVSPCKFATGTSRECLTHDEYRVVGSAGYLRSECEAGRELVEASPHAHAAAPVDAAPSDGTNRTRLLSHEQMAALDAASKVKP